MAISSVNFQKTKPNSVAETTREFEAKYLLKKEYRQENSYWNCGKSDREIYNEQRAIYDEAKKGRGKRPSYENCVWEAVVNFNAEHTLEDMKKVAEHIAEKFNIIPTRIAMHRDEGHLNSSGEVVYNYHAHLNFVTLKDAQQNWTVSKTKNKLSDLQTEVAEILGMERGKFKSEAKRLDHKQYRVEAKAREQEAQKQEKLLQELQGVKNELEAEKVSKAEIKSEFEKLRQESKGKGYEKEFYQALSSEKKKALENIKTKQELERVSQDFKDKHTTKSFFKQKTDYEAIAQKQSEIILEQAEQLETYKEAYKELEAENKGLKAYIEKIKGTLKNVWNKCRALMSEKFPQQKQKIEKQLQVETPTPSTHRDLPTGELVNDKNQLPGKNLHSVVIDENIVPNSDKNSNEIEEQETPANTVIEDILRRYSKYEQDKPKEQSKAKRQRR